MEGHDYLKMEIGLHVKIYISLFPLTLTWGHVDFITREFFLLQTPSHSWINNKHEQYSLMSPQPSVSEVDCFREFPNVTNHLVESLRCGGCDIQFVK